jgi:hypothetical protein
MIENPIWAPQSDKPNIVLTNGNRLDQSAWAKAIYMEGAHVGPWHMVGYTADTEDCYFWVDYGPPDSLTASTLIVPGTIEPENFGETGI